MDQMNEMANSWPTQLEQFRRAYTCGGLGTYKAWICAILPQPHFNVSSHSFIMTDIKGEITALQQGTNCPKIDWESPPSIKFPLYLFPVSFSPYLELARVEKVWKL